MRPASLVLLASGAARRIAASAARCGRTAVADDEDNDVLGVVGSSDGGGALVYADSSEDHAITRIAPRSRGLWAVARPGLHERHAGLRRRGRQFPLAALSVLVPEIPSEALPGRPFILVTRQRRAAPEWAAWWVDDAGVAPMELEILPERTADPIDDLGPAWPAADLGGRVVVVGVGSIGSAVAHALARYGVRDLVLVDYDRLRPHNLVRHQGTRSDIGRYKVDAVRDAIRRQWPGTRVTALRDGVLGGADRMRPLFAESAVVVCAADGVAARRAVSHLAWRARCTAVFACVLRDGAIGEVLRVRPGAACLLCLRAALVADGCLDPEPELDAAYGTGDPHRPMTAVGSDIALVGGFAAKVAVATLLEAAGHYEHRIRQDWALLGLRMDRGAPEPFDLFPGQTHWLPEVERRPGCPTCGRRR